jgi:hypothetical protein
MKFLKTIVILISIITFNETMAQEQFSVLLFTQHDDWHSNTIPVAIQAFEKMADKNQFKFDWTQRPNELAEKLPNYDVLIFMNANADSLNTKHINVLKTFMINGGGFVGIHAVADSKKENPWFDALIGAKFVNHPQLQAAVVEIQNHDFPATWHLPKKWLWSDEWYNFSNINVDSLNVVLSVDEQSYDYTLGYDDIPLKGMGEKHPIAWFHKYEGGNVFYTALGHKPESYKNADFMRHILGGIYWVLNEK